MFWLQRSMTWRESSYLRSIRSPAHLATETTAPHASIECATQTDAYLGYNEKTQGLLRLHVTKRQFKLKFKLRSSNLPHNVQQLPTSTYSQPLRLEISTLR